MSKVLTETELNEKISTIKNCIWKYDTMGAIIWAINPFGHGDMRVADMRGWGHLTGSGACNFHEDNAMIITNTIGQNIVNEHNKNLNSPK